MFFLLLFPVLAQVQPAFRAEVALVHVDAEVRQDGQPLADLAKESFRVVDGGKPQPIVFFGHQEVPLDVILLLDARDQLHDAIERVADTARTAMKDLREGDRVAVMAFSDHAPRPCAELIADFTGDVESVARSIGERTGLRTGARTLHCPISLALANAAQHFAPLPKANRRRAFVVITDDKDVPTRAEIVKNSVQSLWQADAVVLGEVVRSEAQVISIGPPYRGTVYFAGQTGGESLKTANAAEGLREALYRLRSRYSLYYALPPGKPGEPRKIQVKLAPEAARRHPHAIILARTGYLEPDARQ